jgi:hypothetical protein
VLTAHIAPSLVQMRTGEAPLEVTCRVTTKWRDGEFYPVRIIEKRKRDPSRGGGALTGGASDFEYYVHYEQCAAPARLHAARVRADPAWRAVNRRMDSWVTTDMMKLETTEYDQAAAERELAGAGRSRQQKRREDPPPAHGGNVGHAADEVRRWCIAGVCSLRLALRRAACAALRPPAPALQPAAPITPLRRKRYMKGSGAAAKARLAQLRGAAAHTHA